MVKARYIYYEADRELECRLYFYNCFTFYNCLNFVTIVAAEIKTVVPSFFFFFLGQ